MRYLIFIIVLFTIGCSVDNEHDVEYYIDIEAAGFYNVNINDTLELNGGGEFNINYNFTSLDIENISLKVDVDQSDKFNVKVYIDGCLVEDYKNNQDKINYLWQ
jgi:hypothetical protein